VATIIDPDDLDSWCDAVAVCARDPRVNMPAVAAPTWDAAGAAVSGILRQFVGKSEASGDTECVHCVGPDEAQPIRG
jgi:hypothetical protein